MGLYKLAGSLLTVPPDHLADDSRRHLYKGGIWNTDQVVSRPFDFSRISRHAIMNRRTFAQQAIAAGYPKEQFEYEPAFDSLRGDPEFEALLAAGSEGP